MPGKGKGKGKVKKVTRLKVAASLNGNIAELVALPEDGHPYELTALEVTGDGQVDVLVPSEGDPSFGLVIRGTFAEVEQLGKALLSAARRGKGDDDEVDESASTV